MASQRRMVGMRREPLFDPDIVHAPHLRDERSSYRSSAEPRRSSSNSSRSHSAPRRRSGGRGGGRGGRSLLRRLVYWSLVIGVWGLISGVGAMIWVGAHLPPIQSLEIPPRPPTIQIVGLGGRPLATRGDMPGTSVPLRELPPYLPQAFLAIEDRRFYQHFGIDPVGVARAAYANVVQRGFAQGGSTLTQQLAKNLFLTQERTLQRKVQEIVLALWLERKYTKPQILEVYLNRMYFGAGAYGVEAAARRYFNKSARQVTVAEAAMLAGLVKSPSRLAPTRNPDGAERRAQVVLDAMASAKLLSQSEVARAQAQRVTIAAPRTTSANYVADWIMDVLNERVGRVEEDLVVETSIDPALQAAAEAALTEELAQKGAKYGVEQGAIVTMSRDGAVRALVGGKNYSESQFNRAVSARRQPGSAFKPFVYLTALERGLTPDSVRQDAPITLKNWRPENYKHEYYGRVTLMQALARSMNTVAVRLTLEVGPKAVVKTAHRLGIASKLEPNASIALGTSEVSLMELVGAYAVFANGGYAIAPHVIDRVRTATGKTLYVRERESFGRIVDPRPIAMMNWMMQETIRSGTATRASVPGWPVAGKTGTSQEFRDAWFIGYTSHLVTGVWFGNDDGTTTRKMTGGSLPVDAWNRVMQAGHRGGIPVAGLPGGRSDFGPVATGPASPEDLPPGNVMPRPSTATAIRRAPEPSGIDGWFLEKIFGR